MLLGFVSVAVDSTGQKGFHAENVSAYPKESINNLLMSFPSSAPDIDALLLSPAVLLFSLEYVSSTLIKAVAVVYERIK